MAFGQHQHFLLLHPLCTEIFHFMDLAGCSQGSQGIQRYSILLTLLNMLRLWIRLRTREGWSGQERLPLGTGECSKGHESTQML